MTAADWSQILAATIDRARELLERCDGAAPTVMLAELEAGSEIGYYDLRALCREHPDRLAAAGLAYDDRHRALHRADRAPKWAA